MGIGKEQNLHLSSNKQLYDSGVLEYFYVIAK